MTEKMQRFLTSMHLEDLSEFDLEFMSISKDPLQPTMLVMVIEKITPWTYPQLEKFLQGVATLTYPTTLTFIYKQTPKVDDVINLFHPWYEHQFHEPCTLNQVQEADTLKMYYPDEATFNLYQPRMTSFQDILIFLSYTIKLTHHTIPKVQTVDYEKVSSLNEQARAIVEQRMLDEDEALMSAEHADRIQAAEVQLADDYEESVKLSVQAEAKKRIRKKGNYQPMLIGDVNLNAGNVEITGTIYGIFKRDYGDKAFARFVVADHDHGVLVSIQEDSSHDKKFILSLENGFHVRVRGAVALDNSGKEPKIFAHETALIPPPPLRDDFAKDKRIELHLHTKMSTMDGISSIDEYCQLAKHMGHQAIAITDHGVVQGFPAAQAAGKKHGVKIIYGSELYMIDQDIKHIMHPSTADLKTSDYVIFDLETTGLSSRYDRIIEFGGIRVKDGVVIDRLSLFIHPEDVAIQASASAISGITLAMLKDAPPFATVAQTIKKFIEGAILLSHNAPFDIGFLQASFERVGITLVQPVIDTLTLSRFLFADANSHRLGALAKRLDVRYDETQAHRAVYDAEVLHQVWEELKRILMQDPYHLKVHQDLAKLNKVDGLTKSLRSSHITVLARNAEGLKSLYQLISLAHLDHFADLPKTPRSEIIKHREHLLLGSACIHGEVFETARTKSKQELLEVMTMYDFIEIQPLDQYAFLVHTGVVASLEAIKTILLDIIDTAKQLGKLIVATGDVHYVHPQDKKVRDVFIFAKGLKGVNHALNPYARKNLPPYDNPPAHYRSTEDMLASFSWLPKEEAYAMVVTNTQVIANMISPLEPIKNKTYAPKIEGSDQLLQELCFTQAKKQYGDPLPKLVEDRLQTELQGIITTGYGVVYYITSKILHQAHSLGYIIGSRGSVGSSFAATMAGITEVNPLPPHYYCPQCQYSDFSNPRKVKSGFDLPTALCPQCQAVLKGDGQNIPFATFLGFNAEKVPDIDLNFPRDYQSIAHEETSKLLGDNKVYRAGTIETVKDKTAFGYVRGYYEHLGIDPDKVRSADITFLAAKASGVRRTSGQHPGGIVIVPKEFDVHDFTPIQHPADNLDTHIITTHFDFKALHDSLLKFDMLGHVDPLALKMNADLTGLKLDEIPLNDADTIRCFASDDVLHRKQKIMQVANGAMGLPEFGTPLGMDILNVIKPKTFNDLIIISGLAHGENVFNGNARALITDKVATVDEVIGCRDDIMTYLISLGIDTLVAFKIMEDVRRGKQLTPAFQELMRSVNVPEFYIQSANKIKYLFPRAHAAAYVTMAVRAAYFKVHYPLAYYTTFFSLRSKQYDYEKMLSSPKDIDAQLQAYKRIKNDRKQQLSPKDADLEVTLMNVLEMKERGYTILPLDLNISQASLFTMDESRQGIIPPFTIIDGVGEAAALSVIEARKQGAFMSVEDLKRRTKLSSANIQKLKKFGILDTLETAQTVSLFSFDD